MLSSLIVLKSGAGSLPRKGAACRDSFPDDFSRYINKLFFDLITLIRKLIFDKLPSASGMNIEKKRNLNLCEIYNNFLPNHHFPPALHRRLESGATRNRPFAVKIGGKQNEGQV
jgi:hypothetical protein